jgi:hypothetical protein
MVNVKDNRPFVVWDGRIDAEGVRTVFTPPSMGQRRDDQLIGTTAEVVGELAGRICYDSLGTGRASQSYDVAETVKAGEEPKPAKHCEGYHEHIHATRNYSVMEHFHYTLRITIPDAFHMTDVIIPLLNRPGLHVLVCMPGLNGRELRLTLNLRHVLDWTRSTQTLHRRVAGLEKVIGYARVGFLPGYFAVQNAIFASAQQLAPYFFKDLKLNPGEAFPWAFAPPSTDDERWITMYMAGSRGYTHEQVRHGDNTAISQRSTRYVDESESEWVEHPLIEAYVKDELAKSDCTEAERMACLAPPKTIGQARQDYRDCVALLEPWLIARGIDKATARKQARGAARGYLGNAMFSDMLFSASVAQWRWMLHERCSPFADAEIREIYSYVLPELQKSFYADRFMDMRLEPSPDGIGQVLWMAGDRSTWIDRL